MILSEPGVDKRTTMLHMTTDKVDIDWTMQATGEHIFAGLRACRYLLRHEVKKASTCCGGAQAGMDPVQRAVLREALAPLLRKRQLTLDETLPAEFNAGPEKSHRRSVTYLLYARKPDGKVWRVLLVCPAEFAIEAMEMIRANDAQSETFARDLKKYKTAVPIPFKTVEFAASAAGEYTSRTEKWKQATSQKRRYYINALGSEGFTDRIVSITEEYFPGDKEKALARAEEMLTREFRKDEGTTREPRRSPSGTRRYLQ